MTTQTTVHAFQTDRLYTENGQRIAWAALPGDRVLMIDADRCIEYVLNLAPSRDGVITDAMVLDAYDHNRTHASWHPCAHDDAQPLMRALYEAARKCRAPRRR